MRKKIFTLYRTYAFLIFSILTYFILRFRFNLSDYIAIIIANVCCLAFLQIFDFKQDLRLEQLRKKQLEVSKKEQHIVFSCNIIVSQSYQNNLILKLIPDIFFSYASFTQAFSLKYVAEDTDKFISTFSERLRTQLYSNLAIALIIFVLVKPTPASTIPYDALISDPKEMLKVAVTLAGTAINLLILWRPYWYCRERNKSLLNN
jgi:hypothetical protein